MNSPSIQRKWHLQPGSQRLDKAVCSPEYSPLNLVSIMGTKIKTNKDLSSDMLSSNPKQTKKLFHIENQHSLPQPKDFEFFQFVAVPPKVTKIISLGSSKTDVAENKISSTIKNNEMGTTRHSVSAGIKGRSMKKSSSWNSVQGLLKNARSDRNISITQNHTVPPTSPSNIEDTVLNTFEALDMRSTEKFPVSSGKQKSKSTVLIEKPLSNSLKEKQNSKNSKKIESHTDEEKLNSTKNNDTITDTDRRIENLEIEFTKDTEELTKDITEYLQEYSENNNGREIEEKFSSPKPITEKSSSKESSMENLSSRRTGTNGKPERQESKENETTQNYSNPFNKLSRKTSALKQLSTSVKETVRQVAASVSETGITENNITDEDVLISSNDKVSEEEENQELDAAPSHKELPTSANVKMENYKRKPNKATIQNIKSTTTVEQQPLKYGKYQGHMQYFDPLEAAERRRKKLSDKMNKKKISQLAKKETRGPHFDDYGFLAKYCIFNKESWDVYKRIFEMGDIDKKGWLTTDEMMLGLRSINSQLTASREEYLCRIIEMTGYNIEDGADIKLFAILAALSNRITSLDEWMNNIVDHFDYQLLDMKTFKCKTLWEFNVDPDTSKISLDQLCVDLRAGGVSLSHEQEVRSRLQHLNALDLLDFLTYVPLFVMIHNSVVDNPLDSSRGK